MKALENKKMKKLSMEELEQVNGGIAGIDDFVGWFSKKAGEYIRKLFS